MIGCFNVYFQRSVIEQPFLRYHDVKPGSQIKVQPTQLEKIAHISRSNHCLPRNERRNSILTTHHYPNLGSASDWSCCVGNLLQPIRSTTQIWVVTRHQCGISVLASQTSFREETSGGAGKCRLFSLPFLAGGISGRVL